MGAIALNIVVSTALKILHICALEDFIRYNEMFLFRNIYLI